MSFDLNSKYSLNSSLERGIGGKPGPLTSGCPPSAQGILPYSQSSFVKAVSAKSSVMEMSISADFPLVGSGEAYGDCGEIFAVGCLNVEAHKGMTLDGVDMTGKAVVKYVKNSCHRPLCPKCWSDWANRECDSAKRRLAAFVLKNRHGSRLKPVHVIVSVPRRDYGLSLQKLRRKVYRALKRVGLVGGMLIFHSKRKNKRGEWYFSPHFHVIGYGWIHDVRRNYVYSGYVVKNVGVRKTVRGTIYYQLSHAGISEKYHTVTWFGLLAYNKLRVAKMPKEAQICPLCGNRLRRLLWIGADADVLGSWHREVESGFYFDDPSNWRYKPKRSFSDGPEGCEILRGCF